MNLSDLLSTPGYREIVELLQLFENMSIEECASETREIARALAVSRLRSASMDDQLKDGLIDRINKVEFDSVIDSEYENDGTPIYILRESDELGDQADRVLTYRFKRRIKNILLEALSFCTPKLDHGPQAQPAPKLPLNFIGDKQVQTMLLERWSEAWQCANLGLLLSASVVLGSVLEGALVYYFEFVADQTTRDNYDLKGKPDFWKLKKLVEGVVAEVNFRTGVPELTDQIREERNYIHPNVSMKNAPLTIEGLQTNFAIIGELLARVGAHVSKAAP